MSVSLKTVSTRDLNFNFLRKKIRKLLNVVIASALLFDKDIKKKKSDEGYFGEMKKFDEIEDKTNKTKAFFLSFYDRSSTLHKL